MRNSLHCRRCGWTRATSLLIAAVVSARAAADDAAAADESSFIVSGYLPWYRTADWSPEAIGPVTDLIFFGVGLHADGRLNAEALTNDVADRLHAARRANGCRLLLCVGGGGRSEGFNVATADETSRDRLCASLVELCRTHELDGVDFDWEYPKGDRQLQALSQVLSDTKERLGANSVVSVAQSPWHDFGVGVYRAVDRVHVMSYNHRHPQARFEESRRDIERMLSYGCPAGKLVLGLPFYGRNVRGRTKTFEELAGFGRLNPQADMLLGYAFNGRETVRAKTRYALEQNLGGIMVWELGQDVTDPEVSLLRAIELELREHSESVGRRPASATMSMD